MTDVDIFIQKYGLVKLPPHKMGSGKYSKKYTRAAMHNMQAKIDTMEALEDALTKAKEVQPSGYFDIDAVLTTLKERFTEDAVFLDNVFMWPYSSKKMFKDLDNGNIDEILERLGDAKCDLRRNGLDCFKLSLRVRADSCADCKICELVQETKCQTNI